MESWSERPSAMPDLSVKYWNRIATIQCWIVRCGQNSRTEHSWRAPDCSADQMGRVAADDAEHDAGRPRRKPVWRLLQHRPWTPGVDAVCRDGGHAGADH